MTEGSETKFSIGEMMSSGYERKRPGKNSFSGHERNHLFLNSGSGHFTDVSAISGLDSSADGRAFVIFDFDRDGDEDISLVNSNSPTFELFENNTEALGIAGNYIAVRLIGGATPTRTKGWSNRSAIGAKLVAHVGSRKLLREHRAGDGLGSQNSATILIGIGKAEQVDKLEIRWPSGRTQSIEAIKADTLLSVNEDLAEGQPTREAYKKKSSASQPSESKSEVVATTSEVRKALAELPDTCEQSDLTILTTMATWCDSCKKRGPALKQLKSQFADSLCMLGLPVDPDDNDEKLASYEQKHEPAYEILLNLSSESVSALKEMATNAVGVELLPTSIVLNRQREIVAVIPGVPNVSDIRRLLSQSGSK